MKVPRATYSFRMSFWTVPDNADAAIPRRRAVAIYIASRMIAVELIVIDVDTRSSGMSANSASMSSMESIATPTRPTSPAASGVIGVVADLSRQVEGDAEPHHALRQQVPVSLDSIRRRSRSRRTGASSRDGRDTCRAGCHA